MEIRRVAAVYWSATGTTKQVVEAVAAAAAKRLSCARETVDLTLPAARDGEVRFGPGDLVIVGTPTYAGRVPNKVSPYLAEHLHGGGALAAAVAAYGNRSYDNAVAELCALLEGDGFHTVAAAAFVCRHAFTDALAPGRPDGADLEQAALFGALTAEKAAALETAPAPLAVPGDPAAPYYTPRCADGTPAKFLKAKPVTDAAACTRCGMCAAVCPMGAIDPENVFETPGTCIKCQACVRACPAGAKGFDDPAFLSHRAMLEQNFTARKANEVFL